MNHDAEDAIATVTQIAHYTRDNINELVKDSWTCCHNVTDGTYINGVCLWLDRDYEWGAVVEVVDRTTKALTYLAVVRPEGRGRIDFMTYPEPTGSFAERLVDPQEICAWGVSRCFGMLEAAGRPTPVRA